MKALKVPYEFNPNIFFPGYLLRKELYKGVNKHSNYIQGKLLDFGCGAKPYKSLFNVSSYVGLDFMGEGHSHQNEQIDVFYDGHTLPFDDDSFDSIFSSEVFEHVFNLEEILPELKRVLQSGGHILVTCPFAIAEHEQPNDYARYTSFALKHLFKKNGFEIVLYEKLGTHFQTIMQLKIIYISIYVLGKLNRIKLLKNLAEKIVIAFLNSYALVMNKILPKRNDLYMNNLIICKKP